MSRITQIASAVLLCSSVAVYLYFNVVYEAYYYPGAYETGFAATFLAAIMAVAGLIGLVGATIVVRRRRAGVHSITGVRE
jgi:hypothetical protein